MFNDLSAIYFQTDLEKSKKYGAEVLALSEKLGWDKGCLRGNYLVGRCNAVQNNLPQALKHFQAALTYARKMKAPDREALVLSAISAVYATNNDYEKALQHGLQAVEVYNRAGIKYQQHLMVNIGYLYIRQDKYEEALQYYNKALEQELKYGTAATRGELANIYLNTGGVYIRVGKYVPALQHYYKAEAMLGEMGLTKNQVMAQANIGECYIRAAKGMSVVPLPDSLKDVNQCLAKAEKYLLMANAKGEELGLIDIRSEVAGSLMSLYELRKDYAKAYYYQNIHVITRDSLRDISREKEFAQVEAQYAVQKQTDSLNYQNKLKDKEIAAQKLQRNSAIGLVLLAGVISLLLINRQKLKHKQKTDMAVAEARRREELASQQLVDFTRSIQEKNDLLEQFSAELEKYRTQQPDANEQAEKENSLQLLQRSVILNDEQWSDFQALFNKVHTGYINRVKEKYPDLTTAELRSILLTKLGLSNKEMAAMLGVSLEAVRVSKHRLLKKIHLPEDTKLEDWVNTI